MRPIDADKFEEFIRKNCSDSLVDLWCELVRRQPTIEAVPVVHGEWIYENHTWRCGVCGFHPFKGYIPKEPGFNFCPNCEAKMDGGANQ